MGKDLNSLSLKDLQLLEQELQEGLSFVKEKKVWKISAFICFFTRFSNYHCREAFTKSASFQEQQLMEQLEQSRAQVRLF